MLNKHIMREMFLYFWLCIALSQGQNDSKVIDFLTPNRDEMVNFLFPHFTPFSDMMDLVLRASEFGFPSFLRRKKVLIDKIVFEIPKEMLHDSIGKVEFDVHEYVRKIAELAKKRAGRGVFGEVVEESTKFIWLNSFNPKNIHYLVQKNALRVIDYEKYPIYSHEYQARLGALRSPLIESEGPPSFSPKNIPLYLLTMNAWRLLFWTAVSESKNFYKTLEESENIGRQTSAAVPQKLDELSSTFIFHLCSELRGDDSLLPTDLPMGFCPNPCATAPCLTIAHTTGHGCHLTGRGLFMNDFRCECLPGYKWVSNTDIGGAENDTYQRTPSSDEVGSCVAIDVCETYCDPMGTRRCDLILGTAIAVCLCKAS